MSKLAAYLYGTMASNRTRRFWRLVGCNKELNRASLLALLSRMVTMKQFLTCLFLGGALCLPVFAAPLSSSARAVVPSARKISLSTTRRCVLYWPSPLCATASCPTVLSNLRPRLRAPVSIRIRTWSSLLLSAIAGRKEHCTELALRKGRSSRRNFWAEDAGEEDQAGKICCRTSTRWAWECRWSFSIREKWI